MSEPGLRPFDQLTIPQILIQSRKLFGPRIAMRYHDGNGFQAITYDDFYRMVMQVVSALVKAGVKKGDKICILSENRPAWGATYFASLFLKAVNVPLDTLLKPHEWGYIIRNSETNIIVTSNKYFPEIEPLKDEIDTLKTVLSMDSGNNNADYLFADDNPEEVTPADVGLDDIAVIIYTSGTTGLAKGVMLSHGNITSDIQATLKVLELYPTDNFLSLLPIHHTFECTCGFLVPLASGAAITYARGLASKQIVEDIKNSKATIMLGVPLLFEKMYASLTKAILKKPLFTRVVIKATYGLSGLVKKTINVEAGSKLFYGLRDKAGMSSLRLMVSGGAPMSPKVAKALNCLGFRIIQGYGLTESSPVLTLNPIDKYKNDSVGKALPGVKMKVVDANEQGVGEIVACGPMIMKGYYNNDKATSEILKDGWLYTGDLGWVDDEGYYYITGRLKNLIVTTGGKNVYPEEVESVLNKSPYILESLVLGRPFEDLKRGEEIEAIVVPDLEYFSDRAAEKKVTLTEKYIEDTIKLEVARQCELLSNYKRVKYVTIREEDFEKTSTKKIKRYLYHHKRVTVPTGQSKR